jgi:hypothetical protein
MPAEPLVNRTEFEYLGISAGPFGLREVEHGAVMVFIPRAEIQHVELAYGRRAERPTLQTITAAALIAVGCWPLLHLAHWLLRGGMFIKEEAWLVAFGALGAYMLIEVMRKGWYLHVQTPTKARKLQFHGKVHEPDARAFVAALSTFGIEAT